MVSHHLFYQLALLAVIWLFVILHLTGARPARPPRVSEAQAQAVHRAQSVRGLDEKASLRAV